MEHLPVYINALFILTTVFFLFMFYKAAHHSRMVIAILVLWLVLQAVISLSGFYTVTDGTPPRFSMLLIPPTVLILILFLTKKGRSFIDSFDAKTLTLLHVVRIPVELTLYFLFLHKAVPGVMTFEGRNFDVLSGISAPFIYYLGYIKNVLGKKMILLWNIVCLLLLVNIVATALLSAPFPFQQFGFDQPNIALLYFPFVWLPGCIVPGVLFAHLVVVRRLNLLS